MTPLNINVSTDNEKMEEQDNGASQASETEVQDQLGTEVAQPATGSEQVSEEDKVAKAEYEALRKEMDKVAQERNMLRNKIKETELKVLEESENWKGAYEKLKSDFDEQQARLEADREQREAEEFRNQVIDQFENQKVRDAAKRLIAKNPSNLVWSDGATPEQARQELLDQLNSLAETFGEGDGGDAGSTSTATISANNPQVSLGGKRPEEMTLEELQSVLPKADPR